MIQRVLSIALVSATLSVPSAAQSLGKLTGRVSSNVSGRGLPGTTVVLDGSGLGTVADADGYYVILGVPAGSYTIRASYVGFEPTAVRGVVINAGYTRELDFDLAEEVSQLNELVVEYERPMMQRDALGVPRVITGDEIQNLPLRGVTEVATMQAGVVAGRGREDLHVRGGREQETVYFVDGVKVIGYSAVPQQAILEQEMLIGSLPARYGDAMSGIVSITTKSGNQDLFGSIEAISSRFLDGYGYNLASASVGGPLIGSRLSYFLAAEAIHTDDSSPSAIPTPTLTDDRLEFIQNNPQSLRFRDADGNAVYLPFPAHLPPTIDSDGDGSPDAVAMADVLNEVQGPEGYSLDSPAPVDAAEVEPLESYTFRKTTPNSDLDIIRSSGNLTLQANGAVRLRAGYRYEDYRRSQIDSRQLLFNANRSQRVDRETIGIWAAATHRLSGSSFYQIQVDWSQYRETTYDPQFSNDVADVLFYEDIDHPANAVARLYRIWDGNDSLYVPRSEDGRLVDSRGVYNLFHDPGYASPDYSKRKDRQFRATVNVTTQIGLHQLELGAEYEHRVERYYFNWGAGGLARYFDDGSVENGDGVSSYDELPFSVVGRGVTYWGYDYLGLREVDDQDVGRFADGVQEACNDVVAGPDPACNVAPYEPIYYAGYVQDKFEYKDLVVNAGFRVDVFDNNTFVLRDRYALIPIVRAETLPDRPANIGNDFAVYFDNADNVIGFRDLEGNFFDRFGQQASGTDIDLFGAPKVPDSEGAHISPAVFEDYKPRLSWLPRLGVSLSVTDRALFFAHLDKTSQRPFELPFEGLQSYWLTSQRSRELASNNLLPETTLEYELGLRHRLGARAAVSVSGFYKKVDRLIRWERLELAFPHGYVTWGNDDFGTIKGLEIEFDLRRTKRFALTANYTLQYARGTGSDARWRAGRFIAQLRFDRRHTFTTNVDYRLGRGDGPSLAGFRPFENFGLNVLFDLQSGRYFSRHETLHGRNVGPPNGQAMPWSSLVNIRLDRRVELRDGFTMTPFLWIENLFDTDNVRNVYTVTARPDDDGYRSSGEGGDFIARQEIPETAHALYGYYIDSPSNYGIPRLVRMGVRVNF